MVVVAETRNPEKRMGAQKNAKPKPKRKKKKKNSWDSKSLNLFWLGKV